MFCQSLATPISWPPSDIRDHVIEFGLRRCQKLLECTDDCALAVHQLARQHADLAGMIKSRLPDDCNGGNVEKIRHVVQLLIVDDKIA